MRTRTLLPLGSVAFVTGAAGMAYEVLVPRWWAPALGVGLPVWTTTFALVLAGLAAGNAIGGKAADRWPRARIDVLALLLAAAAMALGKPLARLADAAFGAWPLLPRAFASIAVTALPATIPLGAVPSVLSREALASGARAGRALGLLAAAGALGGVLGTYVTGYALVPRVSTDTARLLLPAALVATAFLRLAVPHRGAAALPVATAGAGPLPAGFSVRAACSIAFAAGAALLAVEVLAGRAGSRTAGNGVDTWTNVIGAVLVGLGVGNAVGGRLADRLGPRRAVSALLLVASVATAASVWTERFFGAAEGGSALAFSARLFAGALLAWSVPAAALGALATAAARSVVPAARGDARDGATNSGRDIGLVYAAGTLGAVLASVATGPVLCPLLGTSATAFAFAIALVLFRPVAGARVEAPWVVGLLVVALSATLPIAPARSLGLALGVRTDEDDSWVHESGFARVRVDPVEVPRAAGGTRRARRLTIDGFVHGYVDPEDPTWLGYGYEAVYAAVTDRVAPRSGPPPRAFFVGGGGYVFPRYLLTRFPDASLLLETWIEVAEIDPVVTWAARERMGLVDEPGLAIAHEDARTFVSRRSLLAPEWDLVYADAFSDVSVPWHLATAEFLSDVKARMRAGGVLLMNLVDRGDSALFLAAEAATLRSVFRHVEVLTLGDDPREQETFVLVASDAALPSFVGEAPRASERTVPIVRLDPSNPESPIAPAKGFVLHDDFAPVEALLAPVVRRRGTR